MLTAAPVDPGDCSAARWDTAGNPGSLSSVWKVRATGRTSAESRVSVINPSFTTGVKVDALGLVTAQIGYASNASLFYLKGGAATTGNRLDVWSTATGINAASASSSRWGGAAGIGWEYGFSPNWTAGIEYDHLFMGDANNSFSVANPLLAGAANRISQDVDMITLRFNYKLGGYGASAHY